MRSWKDCNEKKGNFHPYVYLCFTQKCRVKHVIYIFFITWIIYCEVQRLKKRFQFIFSSMLGGKCPLKCAHHEHGMCSKISWKFKKWKLCSCTYGLRLSRRGQVPFWPSASSDEPPGESQTILPILTKPHVGFEPNGCRCMVIIRSYICIAHYNLLLTTVFWIRQKR